MKCPMHNFAYCLRYFSMIHSQRCEVPQGITIDSMELERSALKVHTNVVGL